MRVKNILLTSLLICLFASGAPSYPIDGYSSTNIRRLDYLQRVVDGEIKATKPILGAMKSMDDICLNLMNRMGDSLNIIPAPNPELQKSINSLFPHLNENYSFALLDITQGRAVRYASRKETSGYQPGSVGKLAVLVGFFTELAKIYPASFAMRQDLLCTKEVRAGIWALSDEHTVSIFNTQTEILKRRTVQSNDVFLLYEWLDYMMSVSNNGAAAVCWREAILMRVFGKDYPALTEKQAEEYFAKLKNLPGGLELRGGRYLNRLGFHNSQHQHAWDWSDNYLVSGRFLGDDGLYSMGGELSWTLPLDSIQWESVVSVSVGDAQPEAHEHGEEPDPEPRYEAAGAAWQSTLTAINWTSVYNYNDFHQWRFGISGVFGKNAWNRESSVYGAHASYQWRQNGLEPGGRYFRWSNEAMFRNIDALSGPLPGEPIDGDAARPSAGSFHEWGCYSQVIYGLPTGVAGPFEMGLRMDYVQGVESAGLPERLRLSPSVRLFANSQRTASLAVHYNMDDIADRGTEHSLWLSIALNWGGPEVR